MKERLPQAIALCRVSTKGHCNIANPAKMKP